MLKHYINYRFSLKIILPIITALVFCNHLNAQDSTFNLKFLNDENIEWASEYNTLVNLTSKSASLKKWYLQKVKTQVQEPNNEWLKNYTIDISDDSKEWSIVNKSNPAERTFISSKEFSNKSCCGCDESDAFLVDQILYYQDGFIKIKDAFISPLCLRKSNDSLKWYPSGKFAFNNSYVKNPGTTKLLATRQIKYFIRNDVDESNGSYSYLTGGTNNLINLILRDVEKGTIKASDPNSGQIIPPHNLLKWNILADTLMVRTADGNDKRIINQRYRKPEDLPLLKITEEFSFDFKTEKLYTVIGSVTLYERIKSPNGSIIGYKALCKLKRKN
ncbi:MAG: hypothetical protein ACJ748_02500 [Flavisolibacter sp.]